MDWSQQRELRAWATALTEDPSSERRAVGRAIAMLLDRVESLEQELDRRPPPPIEQPRAEDDRPAPAADAGEDTAPLSLSDRIRAASGRLHHRGD
jgi:hypothetical protein